MGPGPQADARMPAPRPCTQTTVLTLGPESAGLSSQCTSQGHSLREPLPSHGWLSAACPFWIKGAVAPCNQRVTRMSPCSVFLLPPVPALPSFALVYFLALTANSTISFLYGFPFLLSFSPPFPFHLSPFSVFQALSFCVSFSSLFTLNFHDFPWLLLPPVVVFPPRFLFHL